jgi:hypothetical protein
VSDQDHDQEETLKLSVKIREFRGEKEYLKEQFQYEVIPDKRSAIRNLAGTFLTMGLWIYLWIPIFGFYSKKESLQGYGGTKEVVNPFKDYFQIGELTICKGLNLWLTNFSQDLELA